ncbi:MAG: hypothetical protein VSS75_007355 [Candidatus Parabeggiatoa sp.]|nr:hypothetical protein [Candidatus Parabeggiatoa sp.]
MKKSVLVLSLLLAVTENTIAAEPNVDSVAVDSAALHSFQVKEAARIRMLTPEELTIAAEPHIDSAALHSFQVKEAARIRMLTPEELQKRCSFLCRGPGYRKKMCQEAQDSGCGEDCFEYCGEPCDRPCLYLKLPKTPEVLQLLKRLEKLQLPKTLERHGSKGPLTPAERKKRCFEAQKTGCGEDCLEFCGKQCNRACLRLRLPKTSESRFFIMPQRLIITPPIREKQFVLPMPITPQPMIITPLEREKRCQEAQDTGCGEDCVKFCGKPCDRVCE